MMLPTVKKAVIKVLPFLAKYWKEILIFLVITFAVWQYHSMVGTIEYLEVQHEQDLRIIAAERENVNRLRGSVERQNEEIRKLDQLSTEQEERLTEAQRASDSAAAEYDKIIADLMINKPAEVVTCEQNMDWMLDQRGNFEWKF